MYEPSLTLNGTLNMVAETDCAAALAAKIHAALVNGTHREQQARGV